MTEDKPKDQVFTLPSNYVDAILEECEVQISTATDLLRGLLGENEKLHNKDVVVPLVAELLWINDSLLRRLNTELDPPAFYHNEETDEEEYLITEASMMQLQNLMITRFMAVNELNRFSVSICEH
jgi:hypothetical protein